MYHYLKSQVYGKFGHFSGLRFEYSANKPAGERVSAIWINGEEMDPEKEYSVATTEYLAGGGDGV